MIIRLFDVTIALVSLVLSFPVLLLLSIIGLFDTGSPFFFQKRLGKHQKIFTLIKLRTMQLNTKQVGTHLANTNDITNFGHFLRKTKLDELPQLINVLLGQMSLVGPRPGLPSQTELQRERSKRGVFNSAPGITGLAQVNKIDMSTPLKLSRYDQLMLKNLNICLYLKIILLTLSGKGSGDRTQNN